MARVLKTFTPRLGSSCRAVWVTHAQTREIRTQGYASGSNTSSGTTTSQRSHFSPSRNSGSDASRLQLTTAWTAAETHRVPAGGSKARARRPTTVPERSSSSHRLCASIRANSGSPGAVVGGQEGGLRAVVRLEATDELHRGAAEGVDVLNFSCPDPAPRCADARSGRSPGCPPPSDASWSFARLPRVDEGGQRRVVARDAQSFQVVQGAAHALRAQARDEHELIGGDAFIGVGVAQGLGDGEQLPPVGFRHGFSPELGVRLLQRAHPKRRGKHLDPVLLADQ